MDSLEGVSLGHVGHGAERTLVLKASMLKNFRHSHWLGQIVCNDLNHV